MNVNVKKEGSGKRGFKRRVVGWGLVLVGVGLLVVWRGNWWKSWDLSWARVSMWGSGVQLVVADRETRERRDETEMRRRAAVLESFNRESNWQWKLEGSEAEGTRVRVVRFPVWPLMLGALAVGGALMWWGRRSVWRGQRRLTLGVAAVTLGIGVAGVWAWSGWRMVFADFDPAQVTVTRGLVVISSYEIWPFGLSQLPFDRTSTTISLPGSASWELWHWRFGRSMIVPLWSLAAALCGAGAVLVRSGVRARRLGAGACRGCGYDLAGLAAGAVCPECGRKTM